MSATVIIGAQWGDEGKAKFVDFFSSDFDLIARSAGGANAGHTVFSEGQKYVFHLVPSGILHRDTNGLIGNGVVLDYEAFLEEVADLENRGLPVMERLYLSDSMHLILPHHKIIDQAGESLLGKKKIGTTGRGIGPAYEDKMARRGLRLSDLRNSKHLSDRLDNIIEFKQRQIKDLYKSDIILDKESVLDDLQKFYDQVKPRIVNGPYFLQEQLMQGSRVLLEGAQATGLDIDHGTYPFVTSSNPTIGGALAGVGLAPQWVEQIVGIAKAYATRVGSGPFPTEETGEIGEQMRKIGHEFGATTGRPRRCGWLDLEELRMAVRVNGLTEIALTKLDIFNDFDEIKLGIGYKLNGQEIDCFPSYGLDEVEAIYEEMPGWNEDISGARRFSDLPRNAQKYIERIEDEVGVPVSFISVGAEREATIVR